MAIHTFRCLNSTQSWRRVTGDPNALGWAIRDPEQFAGEGKGAAEVLGSVHCAEWVLLGWVRAARGSARAVGGGEGVSPGFL